MLKKAVIGFAEGLVTAFGSGILKFSRLSA